MRLNPANTRLVIAALRGGEFEQTQSYLAADGRYCCLGVTCRVAERTGVTFDVETITSLRGSTTNLRFDEAEGDLPKRAQEWLYDELPDRDTGDPWLLIPPSLRGKAHDVEADNATVLNDEYRFTFSEIADCFEYTLTQQEAT